MNATVFREFKFCEGLNILILEQINLLQINSDQEWCMSISLEI